MVNSGHGHHADVKGVIYKGKVYLVDCQHDSSKDVEALFCTKP
jgi:hypothetical protein